MAVSGAWFRGGSNGGKAAEPTKKTFQANFCPEVIRLVKSTGLYRSCAAAALACFSGTFDL